MTRILITENGQHSAEDWGLTVAESIMPLDNPELTGGRLLKAQSLQNKIAQVLADTVGDLQKHENDALESDTAHITTPLNPTDWINRAIGYIQDVAKDSPWASHFLEEVVVETIKQIIGNHFATVQHIARLWHGDKHPENEHVKAYRALYGQ